LSNEVEKSIAHFYDDGILNDVLGEAGIGAAGKWDFGELSLLGQGVVALANKIGNMGRLKELVGGTAFYRKTDGPGECSGMLACTFGFTIEFYDVLFGGAYSDNHVRGTAVHELAHVIDFRFFLRRLETGQGDPILPSAQLSRGPDITSYAQRGGYLEYWGEAVADWVFGSSYKPKDSPRNPLAADQRLWIERVLTGWGW